jgi:hypothetical protein
MVTENYNWKTHFDTANELMIHTFSKRVKVVTSLKTGEVKVMKNGEVINSWQNPIIAEYERFLLEVAKDVKQLENFTDGE